jgi:NTE family protein
MAINEADGVFQGGGVKGLALVGALLGFASNQKVSIDRWVNVAGTSAGAIIASYLATGHGPNDLEGLLRTIPYKKFEDWGPGGQVLGGAWNLARHHGLAHGVYFRDWFDEQIGGRKFGSVRAKEGGEDPDNPYHLRLIAADVTRYQMLVLPGDLRYYRVPGSTQSIDPDEYKIADGVRASMSIPYFFQPFSLVHAASGEESVIVDGGVLSNFPVWLFDVSARKPERPTFGFQLVGGRGVGGGLQKVVNRLGWPARLGTDIFHTSTEAWDQRFMSHSTRVRSCPVPAGDIGTTDFQLTDSQKDQLIAGGKRAASEFLDSFEITNYVNTFGWRLAQA